MTLASELKLGPYEIPPLRDAVGPARVPRGHGGRHDHARIFRLDFATGKRALWKELSPPDASGISNVAPPAIAADGKTYAYSYNRILSDLFLADGLK